MAEQVVIKLELPGDLKKIRLPKALDRKLESLLDRQDRGEKLSAIERSEAEGLVNLAEFLSLLRLRAQRASRRARRNNDLDSQ